MSDRYTQRIYLATAEGRELSAEEEAHLRMCSRCLEAVDRGRQFESALLRELADLRRPMPADPLLATDGRGTRALPLVLAGGVAAIALFASVATGVIADPNPSPTPPGPGPSSTASPVAAASASPTSNPSPQPTETPAPTLEAVAPGDYAVIAVGELALRVAPVGAPFSFVTPGSEVYVVEEREGWYLVQARNSYSIEFVFGWVPATQDVERDDSTQSIPTLQWQAPAECSPVDAPNLVDLAFTHPQRQLQCYGDLREIRLEGYAVESGLEMPAYAGEPGWLANEPTLYLASAIGPAADGGALSFHLPPDGSFTIPMSDREATDGIRVALVGHYDDDRSTACRRVPLDDRYPTIEGELAQRWCRQQFVVDRVEELGPDECCGDGPDASSPRGRSARF